MAYYTTQIKSVGAGTAVDVQGKTLRFIGNLPCQTGDTVWTDGKVIFGNMTRHDTPMLDGAPSGIPVVADEINGNSNMKCGYFKLSGAFKYKQIAEDSWVTNSDKKYAHGDGTFNGARIIDAEISDNGGLYVVTDGIYRECNFITYKNHLFRLLHYFVRGEPTAYGSITRIASYEGDDVQLGVNAEDKDISVGIFKDDEKITEVSLKPFAEIAAEKSLAVRNAIMARSENIAGCVNFFQQPQPPESFVAMSYARVLAFKISPKGDWDALISASAYGFCFPYLVLDGSVLEPTFNSYYGASKTFSEKLVECLDAIEQSIFTDRYYPFLNVEKYPQFSGTIEYNGVYTPEYQTYIENKIAYYIPLIRFKHLEWYVVAFGASLQFRVHNGEIVDTVVEHTFGGNNVYITSSWNEEKRTRNERVSPSQIYTAATYLTDVFCLEDNLIETDWSFPINKNFYLKGTGYKITGIVDRSGTAVSSSIPPFYQGDLFVSVSPFSVSNYIDAKAKELAKKIAAETGYDDELNFIWHRLIVLPAPHFTRYRDNAVLAKNLIYQPAALLNLIELWSYMLVDGIYDAKTPPDSDDERDGFDRDGYYRLNPSLATLCKDKFLFGNYGGELFAYDNGWHQTGNGLRNFRLRKMKNVNKARK